MTNITDLTRRYRLQVNLGTEAAPNWTTVIGIVEFKPSVEPEIQDDTDYESDGWKGNTKTLQGWSIEMKISHKYDPVTKLYHPTHDALENASEQFGDGSYVHIRYFDRFGKGMGREGRALVTWEPEGGEASELDRVSIKLTGDGPLEIIENPLTEAPLPIVANVTPASGPAAGGELVTINGAYFTGATSVTFDGTAAAAFQVISPTAISAITPAGTAGPCDVAVTTSNGVGTGTAAYTYT